MNGYSEVLKGWAEAKAELVMEIRERGPKVDLVLPGESNRFSVLKSVYAEGDMETVIELLAFAFRDLTPTALKIVLRNLESNVVQKPNRDRYQLEEDSL